ncbi:MAG: DUF4244 domain-containing protein [Nocardioidaceae bacterium]
MTTTISSPLSIRTEDGMNTAEYAVGTVGACGFAGILYKLLTSDWGQTMLQSIFDKVLTVLPFGPTPGGPVTSGPPGRFRRRSG